MPLLKYLRKEKNRGHHGDGVVVFFAIGLSLVGASSYIIHPRGLNIFDIYPIGRFQSQVAFTGLENYKSKLEKELDQGTGREPDCIVFGSSHIGALHSIPGCNNLLNLSRENFSWFDLYSLPSKPINPTRISRLIIEIPPWIYALGVYDQYTERITPSAIVVVSQALSEVSTYEKIAIILVVLRDALSRVLNTFFYYLGRDSVYDLSKIFQDILSNQHKPQWRLDRQIKLFPNGAVSVTDKARPATIHPYQNTPHLYINNTLFKALPKALSIIQKHYKFSEITYLITPHSAHNSAPKELAYEQKLLLIQTVIMNQLPIKGEYVQDHYICQNNEFADFQHPNQSCIHRLIAN